jgi:hypothetical protein
MYCIKHYDQNEDGSFSHYAIFTKETAPWDAPDHVRVECATECDLDKLVVLVNESTNA